MLHLVVRRRTQKAFYVLLWLGSMNQLSFCSKNFLIFLDKIVCSGKISVCMYVRKVFRVANSGMPCFAHPDVADAESRVHAKVDQYVIAELALLFVIRQKLLEFSNVANRLCSLYFHTY